MSDLYHYKKYFLQVMDFSNFMKDHPQHDISHEGELGLIIFETQRLRKHS